jgi:hypothetical protein
MLDAAKISEKIMAMNDDVWTRHSSPLSVYTRFTVLPLLSLAVWSRAWIGIYSLIPIIISILWIWLNPRVFKAPKHTDTWASKGTFGERVYLLRNELGIPSHHLKAVRILMTLSFFGLPFLIYGLYRFDIYSVIIGNIIVMTFKAWVVDRMVWIFDDMAEIHPEFKNWIK